MRFSSSTTIMRKSNRDPTVAKVISVKLRGRSAPGFPLLFSFSVLFCSVLFLSAGSIWKWQIDRFLAKLRPRNEEKDGERKKCPLAFFLEEQERRGAPSFSARVSILTSSMCVDRTFAARTGYRVNGASWYSLTWTRKRRRLRCAKLWCLIHVGSFGLDRITRYCKMLSAQKCFQAWNSFRMFLTCVSM